jgi:hypothetical protein
MSLAAGHYTFLYHRYHVFGIPLACLFTAYAIATLARGTQAMKGLAVLAACVVLLPALAHYASLARGYRPARHYSHVAVAKHIAAQGVIQATVPEWTDAFLLQALLPNGYDIRYVRDSRAEHFTLLTRDGKTSVRERIRL